MTSTADLAASFAAGQEAAREGKSISSRLTIRAGKLRDFWEAGFSGELKKIAKEEAEYRASPEYRAAQERDREMMRTIGLAVHYIDRDPKFANDLLNDSLK